MRRLSLAIAILVATSTVTACRDEPPPLHDPSTVLGAGDQYVALGDSYTAAPGIGSVDGRDGCFRSTNNYPHLVADVLDVELTDVSCGGASTRSMTGEQLTITGDERPPQLDALGPGTDLVTVRIGGNDFGLYGLVSQVCPTMAERDADGSPCTDASLDEDGDDQLAVLERRLRGRVAAVLDDIVERAPDATVLVVGYPAFAPDAPCDQLPIAAGDVGIIQRINRMLNDALADGAERADLPYVDVFTPSRDHHICSEDPWIAGRRATEGRAAPWHPYEIEQRATADLVLRALDRS